MKFQILQLLSRSSFVASGEIVPNPEEPVHAIFLEPGHGNCVISLRWRTVCSNILLDDLTTITMVIHRASVPTSTMARWIAQSTVGLSTRYVGGATIFDLVTYFLLRQHFPHGHELTWRGIDDGWLTICTEERVSHDRDLASICVPMSNVTKAQWALLREMLGEEVDILGGEVRALLDSGFEFHLEGASSPSLYRPSMGARLRSYVLR